jgi:hypothetical protein
MHPVHTVYIPTLMLSDSYVAVAFALLYWCCVRASSFPTSVINPPAIAIANF